MKLNTYTVWNPLPVTESDIVGKEWHVLSIVDQLISADAVNEDENRLKSVGFASRLARLLF
jgi:hypothetical protein